ncbi:MAG: S9 family peptidase [Candidatus Neomarinimicrobiota bacterium]|nr:MAG: S9 family peptidase [Candidatus Neomarinimicrobiota bacterium]
MSARRISISDLLRFRLVSDPQLSPDGQRVVFVVERMSAREKRYHSHLFLKNLGSRGMRPLTRGTVQDSCPRWSPDGKQIAFISKREETSQIWILPMEGGEAYPLTQLPRGQIQSLVWSPAGDRIAFLFHPTGKEVPFTKDGKPEVPVYRHIRDIYYRLDGQGWRDSETSHVWVVDVSTGRSCALVEGPYEDAFPSWSPDGTEIAFISFREEDWQLRLEEQDIYSVSLEDGSLRKWSAPAGPKEGLSFSHDGRRLAYLGHQRPYHSWGSVGYLLNTVDREGKHRSYGQDLDRTAYPLTLGDITPAFALANPVWSQDDREIYYILSSEGGQPLVKTDLETGKTHPVTDPEQVVISFALDFRRERGVFHGARLDRPDELYRLSLKTGDMAPLTNLNPFLRYRNWVPAQEHWFQNGEQRLQGWLVLPPDFDGSRRYPMILNIHGGPRCQYGRTFYHEMYVLAAAGYVVFYMNPRGSQGYGEAFADAITGQWGEPAMSDLMAGVDYVLSLGFVDANRLGVTGGSYGGYMTNWIVTHTDRFAAAVTQRCVSDLRSMFGNSDVGWDLAYEFGGPPWEEEDTYRHWSPITYIERCRTPLLIIHSENDLRCNIEQGDQMFTALKFLKRDVEYVRFPEEFHGLSRHGRPDRRQARLQWIVDWFNRYLQEPA